MIGSMIGAGLQLAGSIFGGISAAKAAKKKEQALKNREAQNQAWYNKNYYADATQRADAQRVLTRTEEQLMSANRRAAATAAVAGGTEESAAAAKEASTAAMADTMSQMAVAAEARKDGIESQYMAKKDQIDQERQANNEAKQQALVGAVQGVAGAAGGVASAVSGFTQKPAKSGGSTYANIQRDHVLNSKTTSVPTATPTTSNLKLATNNW